MKMLRVLGFASLAFLFQPLPVGQPTPFISPIGAARVDNSMGDPCSTNLPTPVSIDTTANVKLVSGVGSKKIYVCSLNFVSATAQNIGIFEGSGSACGTSTGGVLGFEASTSNSAANGYNVGANGDIVLPPTGHTYGYENKFGDDLCLLTSSTGQITGGLTYVAQ